MTHSCANPIITAHKKHHDTALWCGQLQKNAHGARPLQSHLSPEPGHLRLAVALRKQPLVDLRMRLGEASGGAVATLLVTAACRTHNGMATFAEAEQRPIEPA